MKMRLKNTDVLCCDGFELIVKSSDFTISFPVRDIWEIILKDNEDLVTFTMTFHIGSDTTITYKADYDQIMDWLYLELSTYIDINWQAVEKLGSRWKKATIYREK